MTQIALDVIDLRAYYKIPQGLVRAVDGVDLTVPKGEILGVAGESGCGKTTLAKAVLRILNPPAYIHSGKILLNGVDILSLKKESLRRLRWSKLAYVPQSSMNALNPVMKIEDQIINIIKEHEDCPKEKAREKTRELLRLVGLPEKCATMYPHELSGGMRQRAIVCTAMVLEPVFVIADEPTTALDVLMQKAVLQVITDINESSGSTIMLITHDMAVHAEVVHRLAIMYAGKIVELGGIADIFKDPLHPYGEVLMSAIPSVKEKRQLKGISGGPPNLLNPPSGCRFHPRCPKATDICREEEPRLNGQQGRLVACHLYGG